MKFNILIIDGIYVSIFVSSELTDSSSLINYSRIINISVTAQR